MHNITAELLEQDKKDIANGAKTIQQIRDIVASCRYLDWEILVRFEGKEKRPYIQVKGSGPCPITKQHEEWTGRKWFLSKWMCQNEIIRTAYKAIEAAVLHEMNEQFTYKGVRIFDPHINFDKIVEMSQDEDFLDTRSDGMSGAQ